jgi:hypothetical protein
MAVFLASEGRAVAADEVTVQYDAPASCPSRDDFLTKVRSRTSSHALVPEGPDVAELQVHVAVTRASATATLVVVDGSGKKGMRRLVAPTCREAVDGIGLVAALTLDPAAAHGIASESATENGTASPASGVGSAPTAEPGSTPSASTASTAVASDGRAAPPPQAATESPADQVALDESARAKDPNSDQYPKLLKPAEPASPRSTGGTLPSHFSASFAAVELSGPLPHVVPGLELAGERRFELARLFDVGVRLGLRLSAGTALDTPSGDAAFEWWAGTLAVCPGVHSREDVLSLAACATLEEGQTHASGDDTNNPRSSRRNWTSLGPSLRARWAVVPRASLEGGVDALLPFARDDFLIGSTVVHQVQAVAFRASLGVAFRFQ